MSESPHRSFRLLPSEQVLWYGRPRLGTPRDGFWIVVPTLCFAFAAVVALFAGLIFVAGIPAIRSSALLAVYLFATGLAFALAPRALLDRCEYLVTDRHVIWKRGQLRRVIERRAITYARIHWHRTEPGVGHLELVRATPFGPFSRRQRVLLHDVVAPDRLFALIRDTEPTDFAGYGDVQLIDRLDKGERVVWGGAPQGFRLGRSDLLTAATGTLVLLVGVLYAYRTGGLLVRLEDVGLPVRSGTWLMLFSALLISGSIMLTVGAALVWNGIWGARADGSRTEYILTDSRVLIRRGRTELSVDRRRIVDVADQPSTGDLSNLYLILDGPRARALADNGALGMLSPPRGTVPPVLYEVRDRELFRRLLFPGSTPPKRVRDAA
ncbi:MAG TPA: hypothetical protein VF331_17120 [Polyangiales bacterium]